MWFEDQRQMPGSALPDFAAFVDEAPVPAFSNPERSACYHLVCERLLAVGAKEAGHAASPRLISYKAPKLGDKSLRLAVKDLIHIRERSRQPGPNIFVSMLNPAKEDAACLHIARKRGVAIVGKTNRSEFAIGGICCHQHRIVSNCRAGRQLFIGNP